MRQCLLQELSGAEEYAIMTPSQPLEYSERCIALSYVLCFAHRLSQVHKLQNVIRY